MYHILSVCTATARNPHTPRLLRFLRLTLQGFSRKQTNIRHTYTYYIYIRHPFVELPQSMCMRMYVQRQKTASSIASFPTAHRHAQLPASINGSPLHPTIPSLPSRLKRTTLIPHRHAIPAPNPPREGTPPRLARPSFPKQGTAMRANL